MSESISEASQSPDQWPYQWIDTHAHLEHDFPISIDEYLNNAAKNGIQKLVTIGTRPESLQTLKEYAEKYPNVFFSTGIHPHEAKDLNESILQEMKDLSKHPKCIGIGEIGLDYYYKHSTPEQQKAAFEAQWKLAVEIKKPIIIHARDAEVDLLVGLTQYAQHLTDSTRAGVIHCFSGTRHFAEECLKLGFYISFSGIVTFKTAQELRDIAKDIPMNKILLETDAPFLAPVPFRGKPNQSAYLIETAKVVAQAKGVNLETLSRATMENSQRIFPELKELKSG